MRILVISDVHANLAALEAVLDSAPVHDAVWSLGDTVGYGAQPNECIDRLAESGASPSLVGNHDLAAVGLMPIKWFNAYAAAAATWTSAQLTAENRFRIRSGFTSESVGQFYLVHGSPRDPARDYVLTQEDAVMSLGAVAAQVILCGHTHVPMLVEVDPVTGPQWIRIERDTPYRLGGKRSLLNPGSVGQPRDGDSRAAALVLDTDELTASWVRIAYDIERTKRSILAEGLPGELAARLSYGK